MGRIVITKLDHDLISTLSPNSRNNTANKKDSRKTLTYLSDRGRPALARAVPYFSNIEPQARACHLKVGAHALGVHSANYTSTLLLDGQAERLDAIDERPGNESHSTTRLC